MILKQCGTHSENITNSTLAFRTPFDFATEAYEQNDTAGVELVWGLDRWVGSAHECER